MKMSDFDNFSKAIQRKFFRTKEKVLESLGKADKTTDGDFDSLAATFNEQYTTANKLLRAFRSYSSQVKAMSVASKNMHQAVSEAYEPNWDGAENFAVQTEQLNKIWDDHFAKVSETIQFHIVSYVARFPELKNKIAKRGRKLLDYDRARHKLDALERSKKRDEYKIISATRELDAAQTIYETINNELFEELPVIYNSRIPLLSNYFSMFLRTEASFEEDVTKIKRQMAELTAGLLKEQNLIASKAALGTLRAKTLPRREAPKIVPQDKKGRYSPQLAARGIQVRNMDKGATLPPKPPSPKIPPFIYQPPPPKEPAPLPPPTVSPNSPVYSTIGLPKATSTTAPQKPPQPHFGFYTSQTTTVQSPAQANSPPSSSSPPPVPPPPSCLSTSVPSPPPPQPSMSPSSLPPQPQPQVNTKNIISYVPQLTSLSGHSQVVVPTNQEHDNPFEADLRAESGKDQSDLSKAATTAVAELPEAGKNAVEAALEATKNQVLPGKVENAVNSTVEKLSKAGGEEVTSHGVTVHSSNKVGEATVAVVAGADAATKVGQQQISEARGKVGGVLNDASKKVDDEVEKAKEGVSEVGKTITENIDIVAGQMAAAASTTVDGVVNAALSAVGGSVVTGSEVKGDQMGAIILPSNRFLYKVQATHNYSAADTDEMTLETGDVIYVLPINNKEFEDEGWALGLKQKDGVKGMFPVNFTRKMVD